MKKQLLLNLTFLLFAIGVFAQNTGTFSGELNVSDTEDSFQITSFGNGTYAMTLTTSSSTGIDIRTSGYLIAGGGTQGGQTVNIETNCIEINQIINIVIGKASGNAIPSSTYTLSYNFTPLTYNVDNENNENYSQALTTQENTNYEGWFNNENNTAFSDSEDWYKFTSPRNGELEIVIKDGNDDVFGNLETLELYDNSLNLINASNIVESGLTKTYKYSNFNFSGNDFGIKIQGNCVSYQLSWSVDDSTLNIENYNLDNLIKLYPNPVSDYFNITINNNLNIEKVEFIGITGKLIKETNFINNSISIQNLKNGIYFVKIYSDKGIITKKIIKSE